MELIKTYQSKNALSKVLMSTLFKRRQEEADAVIDRAISRLHVSELLKPDVGFAARPYKYSNVAVKTDYWVF